MAAGLGFKTFNTGDVLTAADTNGYLMQGVLVFADAAARSAAITSPQEGQTTYLKDTDVIQVYSGSAWVTKSGAPSPLTTKGDLYTYSTTDARLAVGANDAVLMADSTAATGLKWGTVASGGMTLIATGTGTGSSATITFSSIPSTYKHLYIVYEEVRTATGGASMTMKFNSNSANYDFRFGGTDTTNDWASSIMYTFYTVADGAGTSAYSNGVMWVNDYSGSQANKTGTGLWSYGYSGGGSNGYRTGTFRWRNTAAISSIDIGNSGGGNFSTATVIKLYGVS